MVYGVFGGVRTGIRSSGSGTRSSTRSRSTRRRDPSPSRAKSRTFTVPSGRTFRKATFYTQRRRSSRERPHQWPAGASVEAVAAWRAQRQEPPISWQAVELLRRKVSIEPRFIDTETHRALSSSHRARHLADDTDAIFDFAMVDPAALDEKWVTDQQTEWRQQGRVAQLRRLDSASRARRGGRTSADELRTVVTRDQDVFRNLVTAIEKGETLLSAVDDVIKNSMPKISRQLAYKVYRQYLPLYAAVRARDWTSKRFFDDLRKMASRL